MKILGISLGHDSDFALIEDGSIKAMIEAERFFRQKRYKLSAQNLNKGKFPNTYQYTDIEDLRLFLREVKKSWGSKFDAVSVQNQGRVDEYENLLKVLREEGINFDKAHHINHHLSHASLAYFTSPFAKSLVLSFDGIGNDGRTVFFQAAGNKIDYLANVDTAFGQSYNNLGYIVGIKPEIDGSTAGKVMGLTSYGKVHENWLPFAKRYILNYKKLKSAKIDGLTSYGKGHRINDLELRNIPELKKYIKERKYPFTNKTFIERIKFAIGLVRNTELTLPGAEDQDSQDLSATVQQAWTEEVLNILRKYKNENDNVCVVGGCALNGTTNYEIEKSGIFKKAHFVPNPSDCGLSGGAALYTYYVLYNHQFSGAKNYFSPYLGNKAFDLDHLDELMKIYPNKKVSEEELPKVLAKLISEDLIVGVVRGNYEVGPRALGNRSILCNPLNKDMRDILNNKVKHREWYRPFAPMVSEEDSHKYFTNDNPVPYMSVICDTREEYRNKLPSITHVDGTARIQTVNNSQNPFIYKTLKEFEKLKGAPVLLNTSFNPGGEPILNFCKVALEMLDKTDLDLVLIENTLFSNNAKRHLLQSL